MKAEWKRANHGWSWVMRLSPEVALAVSKAIMRHNGFNWCIHLDIKNLHDVPDEEQAKREVVARARKVLTEALAALPDEEGGAK